MATPSQSRVGRIRRPPARLRDMVPSSTKSLPQHLPRLPEPEPAPDFNFAPSPIPRSPSLSRYDTPAVSPSPSPGPDYYYTIPNIFGVFRRYKRRPQHEPNEGFTPGPLPTAPGHLRDNTPLEERHPIQPWGAPVVNWFTEGCKDLAGKIAPFLNYTTFKLMWWQHTGSQYKSADETQRLVDHVILDPGFDREELRGFSATREHRRLDEFNAEGGNSFTPETGWREGTVTLKLPKVDACYENDEDVPTVTVNGIWYRDLLDSLVAACEAPNARDLHWWPSELFRADPENPEAEPERVYTDFHNSAAFMKEHEAIQSRERNPEDPPDLEYAVVPLIAQSDSTRLAQFGVSSLWPIYIWNLGKDKYIRSLPSAFMAMHMAYVPHVRSMASIHTCEKLTLPSASRLRSGGVQPTVQRSTQHACHPLSANGAYATNMATTIECAIHEGLARRHCCSVRGRHSATPFL